LANGGITFWNKPPPFPFMSLPIHQSLIVLFFDALELRCWHRCWVEHKNTKITASRFISFSFIFILLSFVHFSYLFLYSFLHSFLYPFSSRSIFPFPFLSFFVYISLLLSFFGSFFFTVLLFPLLFSFVIFLISFCYSFHISLFPSRISLVSDVPSFQPFDEEVY
jgi:hypothetical protein